MDRVQALSHHPFPSHGPRAVDDNQNSSSRHNTAVVNRSDEKITNESFKATLLGAYHEATAPSTSSNVDLLLDQEFSTITLDHQSAAQHDQSGGNDLIQQSYPDPYHQHYPYPYPENTPIWGAPEPLDLDPEQTAAEVDAMYENQLGRRWRRTEFQTLGGNITPELAWAELQDFFRYALFKRRRAHPDETEQEIYAVVAQHWEEIQISRRLELEEQIEKAKRDQEELDEKRRRQEKKRAAKRDFWIKNNSQLLEYRIRARRSRKFDRPGAFEEPRITKGGRVVDRPTCNAPQRMWTDGQRDIDAGDDTESEDEDADSLRRKTHSFRSRLFPDSFLAAGVGQTVINRQMKNGTWIMAQKLNVTKFTVDQIESWLRDRQQSLSHVHWNVSRL